MSRFKKLRKHLGFLKALSFYARLKRGKLANLETPNLKHPFKLRNNPYDYATFEEVILNETYDIPFQAEPRYIIDGGGNIGLTACFFASKYPGSTIISIEPDSGNYGILQANCKPYANIHPLQSGIWKRDTRLKITNSGAGNNAFTVTETDEATAETIQAVTLSSVMEQFGMPHIDVLKLDIEGSEKEVFEDGFEKWLLHTRVLIIELHDDMKKGCSRAVFNAVSQYDFSFAIKGENIIFTNNSFK